MKKLTLLFLILPALCFAGGPGKPGMDETEVAYGLLLLFLGVLYGLEVGITFLKKFIKNYLEKRREAHTLAEQ